MGVKFHSEDISPPRPKMGPYVEAELSEPEPGSIVSRGAGGMGIAMRRFYGCGHPKHRWGADIG